MPRLAHRAHSTAHLDGKMLSALMFGSPLGGVDYRRGGLFWTGFFMPDELAMLRRLWNHHREEIIVRFQAQYPDLFPWSYWKFEATEARDNAVYEAAYRRRAQEIADRMEADRNARLAVGQSWKERFADFSALAATPPELREQLRKEQYAALGIDPETLTAGTSPATNPSLEKAE